MPVTRHQVAEAVADKFLPAKKAATLAAAASYECLATMLIERDRARMDPGFAEDILRTARDAADASFVAVERFHQAHVRMAEIREAWAVPPGALGPDDTVKMPLRPGALLELVPSEAA